MTTGIVKGATGTFTATPIPPNGQIQGLPVWSSDNALTTLTASSDGLSVSVATSAADTAMSFNLTISGVSSDGAGISGVLATPLVNPVVQATGFLIQQTS
jgi:hypothetical protein